jgi:hypothetical protein
MRAVHAVRARRRSSEAEACLKDANVEGKLRGVGAALANAIAAIAIFGSGQIETGNAALPI